MVLAPMARSARSTAPTFAPALAFLAAARVLAPSAAWAQAAPEAAAPPAPPPTVGAGATARTSSQGPAFGDGSPAGPSLATPPAQRRDGLVLGIASGLALAGSSGYPNALEAIGRPEQYSASSLLVGHATTVFVLGALTDWFNVGGTFVSASFGGGRWTSTGYAIGLRAEVFPFLRVAPRLGDLGFALNAGIGVAELRADGPYPPAEGGQSHLGVGVFHEWTLVRGGLGHLALAPTATLEWTSSPSLDRHWASLGARLAWYSGK